MIEARADCDAVVRMADGESLLDGLARLGVESGIVVCGIGMLREIELGYWNGEAYETHRHPAPVELVSLQGTIARLDGEVVAHVHVCIAQRDGSTLGGHLFAGTVHNTAEIALRTPPGIVLERLREDSGLSVLRPSLRSVGEDEG